MLPRAISFTFMTLNIIHKPLSPVYIVWARVSILSSMDVLLDVLLAPQV